MRKILVLSLLMMALVLAGCSKDNGKNGNSNNNGGNGNQVEDSQKDKDKDKEDADKDKEEDKEDEEAAKKTVEEKQKELDAIREKVVEAYEHYSGVALEKDAVKEFFGVEEAWYDASITESPLITMSVDTFLAFSPTEGNRENILKALEEYKEYLVNESFQYPMNMDKVKAATILEEGDYIYFIMLGYAEDNLTEPEDRLEAFTKQNEIAVEIIKGFNE